MDERVQKVRAAMLAMQRRPWEQGVAAQALLELGDRETMILLAKDSAYLQIDDGRLAMPDVRHAVTDPAANGVPVLEAARLTGDPALHSAARRMADYLLHSAPRTPDGVIYHNTPAPQLWIDAMYMAPPFLAAMGHFREAVAQVDGLKRALWHPAQRLFSHIWDEGRKTFEREAFWGVGNGWAAAGLVRVIQALPGTMDAERARLTGDLRAVMDGCLAHQRPDGLFHDVVDDPTTFVEVNLAQMLAYSIFRGVRAGLLPRAYLSSAEKMRAAAHERVDEFGFVHDVCGAPNFDRPGIATEGQAFFLLMEAAHREM